MRWLVAVVLSAGLSVFGCEGSVSAPDAGEDGLDGQEQDGADQAADDGAAADDDGVAADDDGAAADDDGASVDDDGGVGEDDGGPIVPRTWPTVAVQPGGLAYWDTPYFADAFAMGGGWMRYAEGEWGESLGLWQNPQFDGRGLPQYLEGGYLLRAIVFGLHVLDNRLALARGHVVLTWRGEGDVRLNGGYEYLPAESSGAETGSLVDGRRVYRYTGGQLQWVEVHALAGPLAELHVWLADPADPQNRSLEGQRFHPTFLARLADRPWGFARFMDWLETNASPQQDWADRRLPDHLFQNGVLNPRAPADGYPGNRGTGAAYEHLVALCNQTGLDLWLNVPHLATDDYVRKLAQLLRYGSDGREPYTQPTADPVHPPLAPERRVFVEYSNEIWSWGDSFCQGEWAYVQAQAQGIEKPAFNARRASQIWSLFQEVFGGSQRVVRVAAVQAGNDGYTTPFLEELRDYGPTLDPPVEPDLVAPTTYFGNGIQDFVYAQPWLDGREGDEGYWTGAEHAAQVEAAFDEWMRRPLSGAAQEGAGPDATGIGGGFPESLHVEARTLFPTPKPLVAYEGGPSIYTNQLEDADPVKGPLTTRFMGALNRHDRMVEVYRAHLEMALSHGLTTHNPFVLVSSWGRYGQWGHLEHLDQDPQDSAKYRFLLSFAAEAGGLRPIDEPLGASPSFVTPNALPPVELGAACDVELATQGGDGARAVTIAGQALAPGLTAEVVAGSPDRARIAGAPQTDAVSYLFLRVADADGDPAWRTFTLRTYGGPGTLVESDLTGVNPARALPWSATYALAAGCGWSGWQAGAGIVPADGDNALFFSVNAPADEAEATLAQALAEGEYWSATLTPPAGQPLDLRGAELRFTVRRVDYHAPRRFAALTSAGGLQAGDEIFTSERNAETDDTEYRVTLPATAAYQAVAAPLEIRLVPFSAQYGGHRAALTAFKLRLAQP
ncbi:MAG TPA: hypothetical protein P5076_05385 [Myxococcota bacterium]|nr:hypothetical protein [Myxococcota bacterium]